MRLTYFAAYNEAIPAFSWLRRNTPAIFQEPGFQQSMNAHLLHVHSMDPKASHLKTEQNLLELLESSTQPNAVNERSLGGGNAAIHIVALFGIVEMLKLFVEDAEQTSTFVMKMGKLHSPLPSSTVVHSRRYICFATTPSLKYPMKPVPYSTGLP